MMFLFVAHLKYSMFHGTILGRLFLFVIRIRYLGLACITKFVLLVLDMHVFVFLVLVHKPSHDRSNAPLCYQAEYLE